MVLTLYHYWSSVCSQKVRFALAEKDISWESRHVDLFRFENWTAEYAAINPRGIVPTLVDDRHVIPESNVILEYLEDAYPERSLRPMENTARALARIWLHGIEEIAHPSVVEASFNIRHRPRLIKFGQEKLFSLANSHPDPDFREDWLRRISEGVSPESEARCYRRLERLADAWNAQLARTEWLAGEDISIADIAVAPYVHRIEVLAHSEILDDKKRPDLADWWQRIQSRPAFQEAFSFANPDKDDPIKR